MEEICATNPKYQPLRVLWCLFACPCSKNHPFGNHLPVYKINSTFIKTHGSESRGQEEAAVRDERVSYLHVALL